jgi:hypothetical protein
VLWESKGLLGHSAEMRERERQSLAVRGIQIYPRGSREVLYKPWTGSAHCTLRRDVLDSAKSLSGLEEKPSY